MNPVSLWRWFRTWKQSWLFIKMLVRPKNNLNKLSELYLLLLLLRIRFVRKQFWKSSRWKVLWNRIYFWRQPVSEAAKIIPQHHNTYWIVEISFMHRNNYSIFIHYRTVEFAVKYILLSSYTVYFNASRRFKSQTNANWALRHVSNK